MNDCYTTPSYDGLGCRRVCALSSDATHAQAVEYVLSHLMLHMHKHSIDNTHLSNSGLGSN